ncbi:MAG: SelB C-terminal domain-containing protein, partial [Dehalococcoidales bacterium]|nr:SelB C-terminal domain-containing protein [Dehalococcoidales bacterium]
YVERGVLLQNSCYSSIEIAACVRKLLEKDKLVDQSPYIVGKDFWQEQADKLLDAVHKAHEANPLSEGVSQSALMACLDLPRELFNNMIYSLVKQGKIIQYGDTISSATYETKISPRQEAMISGIMQLFVQNPSNPPTSKELALKIPGCEDVIRFMCRRNMLVEVDEDILLEARHYQQIKNEVIAFLKEKGQITIQDFYSISGFSRKYTIPILTALDMGGITRREGEKRVLCSKDQ